MTDQSWRSQANCLGTDPSLFFSDLMFDGGSQRAATDLYADARQVCAGCVVREECLEYGMSEVDFGMYGGLTPKERRNLITQRRRQSLLAS